MCFDCPICLDKLEKVGPPSSSGGGVGSWRKINKTGGGGDNGNKIVTTSCGHLFHWKCISSWATGEREGLRGQGPGRTFPCPSCQRLIILSKVVTLYPSQFNNNIDNVKGEEEGILEDLIRSYHTLEGAAKKAEKEFGEMLKKVEEDKERLKGKVRGLEKKLGEEKRHMDEVMRKEEKAWKEVEVLRRKLEETEQSGEEVIEKLINRVLELEMRVGGEGAEKPQKLEGKEKVEINKRKLEEKKVLNDDKEEDKVEDEEDFKYLDDKMEELELQLVYWRGLKMSLINKE